MAAALDGEIEAVSASPDALDALLQRQNYRLAFWRTASEEGQYRRFFDINELVGIRVEEDAVFADSHRLILRWIREGIIDGLRVDHVDGLRDPLAYLLRLDEAGAGVWALVEKILARGEELPPDWPVAGTTGYDWLNVAGGLFVKKEGAGVLEAAFNAFTGSEQAWEDIVHDCKIQVLDSSLASDLTRVVEDMARVCEGHRRHSDHTRKELRECLAEVIAAYSVYRTYVSPGQKPSERDITVVTRAIATAGIRCPDIDGELLTFLRDVLLLQYNGAGGNRNGAAVPAGYQPGYGQGGGGHRLLPLYAIVGCKRGGRRPGYSSLPMRTSSTPGAHRSQSRHPFGLLATSTHDTKRSEDVRARLSVLSEMPEEWVETTRDGKS